MDLDKYTSRLRDDLAAAAALGDEKTRATADALAGAAAASARLMLLAALTDFAAEVSENLGDRTVHVAADGNIDVRKTPHVPEDGPTIEELTGDISRVTLRLVDQMKSKAEEAAAASGVSLNYWLGQAVQGALREQARWRAREHN